jgi:16S rRNA (adenine1518-N6/adenine1519-N6)-dimethyltransferase
MSSAMRQPAKRHFGQHFLRDTGILRKIAALVSPGPETGILEIGAGDGALTSHLVLDAARLVAVEIDTDCWGPLEGLLARAPDARLVRADVLTLDLSRLAQDVAEAGRRFVVAGNLPYNIATAIIDRCLRLETQPELMVFMVQLEVAQRITALPGTRQYGLLSVLVQQRSDARIAFRVSPGCFVPRPRVESAVVTIRPRRRKQERSFEQAFDDVLKAGFSHRRKTLVNSLKRDGRFADAAVRFLAKAGITAGRRAESLSVVEWERLAAVVEEERSRGPAVS